MEALARACRPRLEQMLRSLETGQGELSFETTPGEVRKERAEEALSKAGVADLPEEIRTYVDQAVNQLAFSRAKNYANLGSAFSPLLLPFEQLCGEVLRKYLGPRVPMSGKDREFYFDPYLDDQPPEIRDVLIKNQRNLQKFLLHFANCNRIGTLLFCINYALEWNIEVGGIWKDVRTAFRDPAISELYPTINEMNKFRNRHVAHVDEPLSDGDAAEKAMLQWIQGLARLHKLVADKSAESR